MAINLICKLDLTQEVFEIYNSTSRPISVAKWQVLSLTGHERFTYPAGTTIPQYQALRLRSGHGADSKCKGSTEMHWCNRNIWNNRGDVAALVDHTGKLVQIVEEGKPYNNWPTDGLQATRLDELQLKLMIIHAGFGKSLPAPELQKKPALVETYIQYVIPCIVSTPKRKRAQAGLAEQESAAKRQAKEVVPTMVTPKCNRKPWIPPGTPQGNPDAWLWRESSAVEHSSGHPSAPRTGPLPNSNNQLPPSRSPSMGIDSPENQSPPPDLLSPLPPTVLNFGVDPAQDPEPDPTQHSESSSSAIPVVIDNDQTTARSLDDAMDCMHADADVSFAEDLGPDGLGMATQDDTADAFQCSGEQARSTPILASGIKTEDEIPLGSTLPEIHNESSDTQHEVPQSPDIHAVHPQDLGSDGMGMATQDDVADVFQCSGEQTRSTPILASDIKTEDEIPLGSSLPEINNDILASRHEALQSPVIKVVHLQSPVAHNIPDIVEQHFTTSMDRPMSRSSISAYDQTIDDNGNTSLYMERLRQLPAPVPLPKLPEADEICSMNTETMSSLTKIKLWQFMRALGVAMPWLLGIFFIGWCICLLNRPTHVFCDTELYGAAQIHSDCIPCEEHGYCAQGRLWACNNSGVSREACVDDWVTFYLQCLGEHFQFWLFRGVCIAALVVSGRAILRNALAARDETAD